MDIRHHLLHFMANRFTDDGWIVIHKLVDLECTRDWVSCLRVKKDAMMCINVGSLMHYTELSCWLVKHIYKYIYEDKHTRHYFHKFSNIYARLDTLKIVIIFFILSSLILTNLKTFKTMTCSLFQSLCTPDFKIMTNTSGMECIMKDFQLPLFQQ